MLTILQQVFPTIFVIIAVFILKKIGYLKEKEMSAPISKLAFDIVLPALLFNIFSTTSLEWSDFTLPLIPILFLILLFFVASLFFKVLKVKDSTLLLTALTGLNVGVIYPFVERRYSAYIFSRFVLIDLGSLIIIFTLMMGISAFGDKSKKFTWKEALKNIFINPIFVAMIIGILVNLLNIPVPEIVMSITSYIAAGFGFLTSFVVGINLDLPKNFRGAVDGIMLYISRILLACLFCLGLFKIFTIDKQIREIIFLVLLTPVAMLTVVFAQKYKLGKEKASEYVTFSLVLFIILLPVILWVATLI
jgi:hypothetical protein